MTLRTHVLVLAATAGLFVVASPGHAMDFGIRGGAYVEDSDPFVGIELLTQMGSSAWYFNPNLELVFADPRDRASLNFDFHYDFVTRQDYYVWAGGGLAVIHIDGDGRRDSETDVGANLLAGVGWRLPDLTPYAQLKVVVSDDAELVAGVGVRF